MKTPTLKQKVEQYELFLHKINSFIVSCNNEGVRELVANADNWSYAHRRGEFLTDKQRDEIINNAFWNLLKTPNADRETEERQISYTKLQKERDSAREINLVLHKLHTDEIMKNRKLEGELLKQKIKHESTTNKIH